MENAIVKSKQVLFVFLFQLLIFGMGKNAPASVPVDAVVYNGNYYKLFNAAQTWSQAKASCESEGGHLVTITSAGENSFVLNLIKSHGTKNSYWLGAKLDTSGTG